MRSASALVVRGHFEAASRPHTIRRLGEALDLTPVWWLYGHGEAGNAAA
jgi:hypothetical protein